MQNMSSAVFVIGALRVKNTCIVSEDSNAEK